MKSVITQLQENYFNSLSLSVKDLANISLDCLPLLRYVCDYKYFAEHYLNHRYSDLLQEYKVGRYIVLPIEGFTFYDYKRVIGLVINIISVPHISIKVSELGTAEMILAPNVLYKKVRDDIL